MQTINITRTIKTLGRFLPMVVLLGFFACGGGSDNSSNNAGEDPTPTGTSSDPQNSVVVLKNETGFAFGPVNDAFAVLIRDARNDTRAMEIIFTEDVTVRNICNNPNEDDMEGFGLISALLLVNPSAADAASSYIDINNDNIVRTYEGLSSLTADGIQGFAFTGLYIDNTSIATSTEDEGEQNQVTIQSADLQTGGRITGDLSILMVDDTDPTNKGLLEIQFNVPFLCEI